MKARKNTEAVAVVAAETVGRSAKWRKALIPLTTLAAAGALAVGSGADFSSQTANPNSIVASGTLLQTNSKAGSGVLNISNIKPGDVVSGDVTITNSGTLPAVMSVTEVMAVNSTNPFLAATSPATGLANLNLKVLDGATEVYNGNFGAMGTKPLGTFTAGQAKTYKFVVTFAQSAGNNEQGKSASATYTWNGAQTSNVTLNQPANANTSSATPAQ